YLAVPETLSGPSSLETRLPSKLRSFISGHLYSGMGSTSSHLFSGLQHRVGNARISSTTTEIATQAFPELFYIRVGMFIQESFAGHNEAWCTVTALLGIVVHKGLLNWM